MGGGKRRTQIGKLTAQQNPGTGYTTRYRVRQDAGSLVPSTSTAAIQENDDREMFINEEKDDDELLLNIFPIEIWTVILGLLKDSNDFANVCNSSLFFRDILYSQRTTMLFPKIFEILCGKLSGTHPKPEYKLDVPSCSFPPWVIPPWEKKIIAPYNHKSEILNLRLVCHTWGMGVDKFYQQLSHLYAMNLQYGMLDGKWHVDTFYQHSSRRIDKFLQHFDETHTGKGGTEDRSPFVGRAVSFCSHPSAMPFYMVRRRSHELPGRNAYIQPAVVLEENPEERFRTAIASLLLKYGHHVWHCTIQLNDTLPTRSSYYAQLREWLKLMPNLRSIRIIYKKPVEWFTPLRLPYPTLLELNQLERYISTNPLPKLDHLEFIYAKNLPVPFFRELITKNNQINMLEMERNSNFPVFDYNLSIVPMTNLTQLSMQIFEDAQFTELKSSRDGLRLNTVYLDFKHCSFIQWSRVFSLLGSKWGDTLTNVRINLPLAITVGDVNYIMKESFQFKMNLPLVKRIKLKIRNYSTLDFILPMKGTLEVLEVIVGFDYKRLSKTEFGRRAEARQTIQFLGYFNRLLESNIWTIFPKLQRIEFLETYLQSAGRDGEDTLVEYIKFSHTRKDWEMDKIMKEEKAMRKVIKRITRYIE